MEGKIMTNLGLIPLRNFAQIDSTLPIYRSAQPEFGYEYEWLKQRLGIKKIIDLREEKDIDTRLAKDHGIEVVKIPIKDHCEPTETEALQFIEIIREQKDVPTLFHCAHGHGRTSTFCVLMRLAQNWTLEDAIKEETETFGYDFKHPAQINFLTNFYSKHFTTKNQIS